MLYIDENINPEEISSLKDRLCYLMDRNGFENVYQFVKETGQDSLRTTIYCILSGEKEKIKHHTADKIASAFDASVEFVEKGGCKAGCYKHHPTEFVVVTKNLGDIRLEVDSHRAKLVENVIGLRPSEATLIDSVVEVILKFLRR